VTSSSGIELKSDLFKTPPTGHPASTFGFGAPSAYTASSAQDTFNKEDVVDSNKQPQAQSTSVPTTTVDAPLFGKSKNKSLTLIY